MVTHLRTSTANRSAGARAFTLVEMLVVMAIIVILLALVVPATVSLLRGSQISQAGDLLLSQLDLARQTALSRNRSVEFRICRPTGGSYTAIMPLLASTSMDASGIVTTTYAAVGRPVSLPNATIIDSGAKLSTVLNPSGVVVPMTATTTDPPLGSLGTAYQYVAFQFKPDGSTDLVTQTSPSTSNATNPVSLWFLTVHNATDGDNPSNLPSNYYTIQIDAYDGHAQEFRP